MAFLLVLVLQYLILNWCYVHVWRSHIKLQYCRLIYATMGGGYLVERGVRGGAAQIVSQSRVLCDAICKHWLSLIPLLIAWYLHSRQLFISDPCSYDTFLNTNTQVSIILYEILKYVITCSTFYLDSKIQSTHNSSSIYSTSVTQI